MFHTYPESAARASFELTPGRRSWNWFELACNVPVYFVHIEVPAHELTRQFVFTQLGPLLDSLHRHPFTEEGGRLGSLYVIAPGYLSHSPHPIFFEVAEVWAKPDHYHDLLYIARDGSRHRFTLFTEPTPESEMECILKIYSQSTASPHSN